MTFGEKLKKLRKKAGISQEELSFQLQVSRQAISKWENDKGFPEIEKVIKMSNLFQVSLDDLLNGSENRNKNMTENTDGFYVSQEMASGYLLHETLRYSKLAWAIALLLAGTALVFLFDEIGVVLYLIMMIISITLFVSILLVGNPYPQLKQNALLFDDVLKKELLSIYTEKRKRYHFLILISIILFCIGFLVLPLVVGLETFGDGGDDMVLAISMILGGAAVYFFIYLLGSLQAYRLLTKNVVITEGKDR